MKIPLYPQIQSDLHGSQVHASSKAPSAGCASIVQSLLFYSKDACTTPCASDAVRSSVGDTCAEEVPADEQLPSWAPSARAYFRKSRPLNSFQDQPGPDLAPIFPHTSNEYLATQIKQLAGCMGSDQCQWNPFGMSTPSS